MVQGVFKNKIKIQIYLIRMLLFKNPKKKHTIWV